jgi:hypothetical protein
MEKSLGAHVQMQLREARGFGGLVWPINVTAGFRRIRREKNVRCGIGNYTEPALQKHEGKTQSAKPAAFGLSEIGAGAPASSRVHSIER